MKSKTQPNRVSGQRESLDDEDSVKELIREAKAGDLHAAWLLIHQIQTALERRSGSKALLDYAALFFDRLLELREKNKEAPNELADALNMLHLARPHGRPRLDDETATGLAARVVLLRLKGCSADEAMGSLADTTFPGEKRVAFSGYKAAYYGECSDKGGLGRGEHLNRILGHSGRQELEALAGFTTKQLVDIMTKCGTLPS